MPEGQDLRDLDEDALVEALVGLAQRARRAADNDRIVELGAMLAEVKAAAESSVGTRLAILEVAEAFLRTLARREMGKAELGLRAFAHGASSERLESLHRLALGASITIAPGDRPEWQGLIDVGAVREGADAGVDLRPSLRNVALDLVEPVAFRLWRRVEAARSQAALARMKPSEQAAYLAGEFGVTLAEARQHFAQHPLLPKGQADVTTPIVTGVVYKRAPFPLPVVSGATKPPEESLLPAEQPGETGTAWLLLERNVEGASASVAPGRRSPTDGNLLGRTSVRAQA